VRACARACVFVCVGWCVGVGVYTHTQGCVRDWVCVYVCVGVCARDTHISLKMDRNSSMGITSLQRRR